jgi:acyl-[acyl-carrier-protein]-phospholipid O-acyltransferase/long-chain-fatty-acid--[acyl-carrier-protein] ligase
MEWVHVCPVKQETMKTNNAKWTPLFLTQALGVLNDNILKGAISFIAVTWVPFDDRASVIALASALLVLPYLFVSPWASRLSVRYKKSRIVNLSKLAEIPIMMIAVAGFLMQSLVLSMLALTLMGLQSAVYSPSKYGLIRDVKGKKGINFGTGIMELLTFTSVLGGMVLAGFITDIGAGYKLVLCGIFMVLAVLGWYASNKIKVRESETEESSDSINPIKFISSNWKNAKSQKGLRWTVIGLGVFWFLGSLLQMTLLIHMPSRYGLDASETSLVIAAVAVGIGLGCWIAGIIVKSRTELGLSPIGGILMATCLTILAVCDLSLVAFSVLTFLTAFFSGLYKVPLNSWVQERVPGRNLGRVLAMINMMIYAFVLVSALVFQGLVGLVSTEGVFFFLAGATWLMAAVTLINVPDFLLRFLIVMLSKVIYRVRIHGHDNIPKTGGALIVANHVSYLDFMLIAATVPRQLRFVMLSDMYKKPGLNWLLKRLNMIPINARGGQNDLRKFNRLCQAEINAGHVVCIFSEGTVTRTGQLLEFKKGIEFIGQGIDAPVIPIHLGDVIGTPFTFKVGDSKMIFPRLSTLCKKVHVSVGAPLPSKVKAFEIRQAIKELEAESFGHSVYHQNSVGEVLHNSLSNKQFQVKYGRAQMSSKELLNKAVQVANRLQKLVSKHECIAVLLPKNQDSIAVQCALQFCGKTVVNLSADLSPEARQMIMRRSKARVLITTDDLQFTRFAPIAVQVIWIERLMSESKFTSRVANFLDVNVLGFNAFKNANRDLDKPATIIFENGEGHEYKAIPLSHKNILAHLKATSQIFGDSPSQKFFSDFELGGAVGFVLEFIHPIAQGLDIVVANRDTSLIKQILTHKPEILLTSAEKLGELMESGQDLSFLQYVHTERPENHQAVSHYLTAYGIQWMMSASLGECCSVFTANTPDFKGSDIAGRQMFQVGSSGDSVGKPLPGVAIKIVDLDHPETSLGPEEAGTILVKGATVIKKYFDQRYQWSKNFYNDWLVTPMRGYIDQRGFLVLV